jgi:hypothetical protein
MFCLFVDLKDLRFCMDIGKLWEPLHPSVTTPPVHFCSGYFGHGVLQTICLSWPGTEILPISTSKVARIIEAQVLGPIGTFNLQGKAAEDTLSN